MDKIEVEDVNDTIALERAFARTAFKYLSTIEYTKPSADYEGERLRTDRELENMSKNKTDKVKRAIAEKKIEKEYESSESLDEDLLEDEEEVSKRARVAKNKKKYVSGVTRGKRKKAVRSKKKANRRRGNR